MMGFKTITISVPAEDLKRLEDKVYQRGHDLKINNFISWALRECADEYLKQFEERSHHEN